MEKLESVPSHEKHSVTLSVDEVSLLVEIQGVPEDIFFGCLFSLPVLFCFFSSLSQMRRELVTYHERLASKILSLKKFLSQLEGVLSWLSKNKSEILRYKELTINRKKSVQVFLVRCGEEASRMMWVRRYIKKSFFFFPPLRQTFWIRNPKLRRY